MSAKGDDVTMGDDASALPWKFGKFCEKNRREGNHRHPSSHRHPFITLRALPCP